MKGFIRTTKVQAFLRNFSTVAKPKTATISIAAGAAGTLKNFTIPISPIACSDGADLGGYGDSSVSFGTGVFDVEVPNNTKDADMANGEYCINYLTGEGRGKKKTTGTSEAVTWKYFVPADSPAAASTHNQAEKLVATPGTQVPLVAVSTPFRWAMIQAQYGNGAKKVYIGKSNVDKATSSTWSCVLTAGASFVIPVAGDLADYWEDIDTGGAGMGVNIFYLT